MSEEITNDRGLLLGSLALAASAAVTTFLLLSSARLVIVLTGASAVLSSLGWLITRRRGLFQQTSEVKGRFDIFPFLVMVFLLIFSLSIYAFVTRVTTYERPTAFLFLVSMMVGVVALELLLQRSWTKLRTASVLGQIILIGITLEYTVQLVFPSVIGVDPQWHEWFTNTILQSGHIPPNQVYSSLPLFHLLVGSTELTMGTDYRFAAMLSISTAQVVLNSLMVFALGRMLFGVRAGALSALVLSVANYNLDMGSWIIPNSLAVVWVPLILYLLLKSHADPKSPLRIVAVLLMAAVILTHTVASMGLAIILTVSWIATAELGKLKSGRHYPRIGYTYPMLFWLLMFGWWTYASGYMLTFSELIRWGFSIDSFAHAPQEMQAYSGTIPLLEQVVDNLGIILFFSLSLIGLLYLISSKSKRPRVMGFCGAVAVLLPYLTFVAGRSILEDRWWYLAQIFLSVPLAVGLLLVFQSKRRRRSTLVAALFTVVILSFLLIISPSSARDNHDFSPNSNIRYALTYSEMQTGLTVGRITNGNIITDQFYSNYLMKTGIQSYPADTMIFTGNFTGLPSNSLLVIRSEIETRPFLLFSGMWRLNYSMPSVMNDHEFSEVYDCGSTSAYLVP